MFKVIDLKYNLVNLNKLRIFDSNMWNYLGKSYSIYLILTQKI